MTDTVLLDAGVVTRCRRRVHLEHDPGMTGVELAPLDSGAEQRIADAATHRRQVADSLAARLGTGWVEIPRGRSTAYRELETLRAMRAGTPYIWAAQLPTDEHGGRRGGIDLLVRCGEGYVPVLVVRHKVTDPGTGARTSPLDTPLPDSAHLDPHRKARPQARDQLRLAHAFRLLQAAGRQRPGRATGGAIGMDADVVVWHDLDAPTWPGNRTALDEYDHRFADRLAVATAAASGADPLATPSRIMECRSCPWWPICEDRLRSARDVSLVVRGEDAVALREAGITTVDALAALDPEQEDTHPLPVTSLSDAVALARAWRRDLSLVRRSADVSVPRADVELDVDMESFGDAGAYLWGCWLSGADIGLEPGYRAFATWEPVPTEDEARSFGEFWTWLRLVRSRARERGLTFRAYCYNELAENRWMLSSAERFPGRPGVPTSREVRGFIRSDQWVDIFASVRHHFLCAKGKGLKTIAPEAGFGWRDPEASGENSMRWYRDAVGYEGQVPDLDQRDRLLTYNEDDVRATLAVRDWMCSPEVKGVPFLGDL
ncbi:recombinase RecB [Actinoalloteichus sp. AHMU CJ021]|uniref:RecB family nuclease, putative, TM0106 family n=2 Tax=Actinoalloteichus cyanogriseus TaxID=2893586 RepID=A0ABT1JK81_ACTCY|nr:TM0106 family RecB-like putative nuclease [Actinoalloteichus caeruleus]AUS78758.1 recombinase RecB [Actinoalloteichus sp. AHMU CJ021]MCP2332918.1 RecB family nuclease, putative, TM0106 family [Actinoalloteichus caeruleus DSM 43889]